MYETFTLCGGPFRTLPLILNFLTLPRSLAVAGRITQNSKEEVLCNGRLYLTTLY
jgi:hypothetical protein